MRVSASGIIGGLVTRIVWLLIAALIALGGAGIAATVNQLPGTPGRADLTYTYDSRMAPKLDDATVELQALADQVDGLSAAARNALTFMVAGDGEGLTRAIDEGTNALAHVQGQVAVLQAAVGAVPYTGETAGLYVSADLIERYQQLAGTVTLTTGLEADWASFSGQAASAITVSTLLGRHDRETAAAAEQGAAAHYAKALKLLDVPDATIAQLRTLQEALAKHTDTGTLAEWIRRNADYDAALRTLYTALVKSKGHVTSEVRAAFDAEKAARAALPTDTKGLVVIMNDIAQGGLNQAVISIEGARGKLSEALDLQRRLQDAAAATP